MRHPGKITFWLSGVMIVVLLVAVLNSCKKTKEELASNNEWFEFVMPDLDVAESAVDMSFLNTEEAGKSGFVTIEDGHFIDGAGNPVRFFGTNFTFSSAFPDKETATKLAGRLKKLGYNVVRFHHMDNRVAPGGIWDSTMVKFDPEMIDRLDWIIYQLKLNGIYTNLNLHVSRAYPGLGEVMEKFKYAKSIDNFYHPYIELQKDYAKNLLTHVNAYTGNAYTDEPAVAFVEVNNENSLLSNWKFLPQLDEKHKSDLKAQWDKWLGGKDDYQSAIDDDIDLYWIAEHYDSLTTDLQKEAFWAFLVETEMSYTSEIIGYIKNNLKINQPISLTQASYSGVAGVIREATYADWIDMHAYWEHPSFPNKSWSSTDWLIRNSSMVSDKKAGTLDNFAMHNVKGMPLTVSEYDHPAPNDYSAEMYPMLTSVAAYQNWDGLYHFTYNAPWDEQRISGFFSASGHPLKQVFLPIGAVIFRMGAVRPGENIVQLHLPENEVLPNLVEFGHHLRLHGSNMDKIWEKQGAPNALTILNPMEVVVGGSELKLSQSVAEPAGPWGSETNEIQWDNRDSTQAIFTINAPAVKSAVGYIGGKSIELGEVVIEMSNTETNWASIALASLDGQPISSSQKILLVAAGKAENTDMGWNETRTTVMGNWGKAPVIAEGIPATISMKTKDVLKVNTLNPAGNIVANVPTELSGDIFSFDIGSEHKTLWYLITR